MTKEQVRKYNDLKFHFVINETEELRKQDIGYLGLKEGYEKVLRRYEIHTIGDLIDKWNELHKFYNAGVVKVAHIRAAAFAYFMEEGVVKETSLVQVAV